MKDYRTMGRESDKLLSSRGGQGVEIFWDPEKGKKVQGLQQLLVYRPVTRRVRMK